MFGNKSIGEAEWKPHNWNVETNPNTEILTTRLVQRTKNVKININVPMYYNKTIK